MLALTMSTEKGFNQNKSGTLHRTILMLLYWYIMRDSHYGDTATILQAK